MPDNAVTGRLVYKLKGWSAPFQHPDPFPAGKLPFPSWCLRWRWCWGLSAFAFTPRWPMGPEAAWSIPFTDTSWEAVPGRAMISADDRQLKSVQGGLKGKEKKTSEGVTCHFTLCCGHFSWAVNHSSFECRNLLW